MGRRTRRVVHTGSFQEFIRGHEQSHLKKAHAGQRQEASETAGRSPWNSYAEIGRLVLDGAFDHLQARLGDEAPRFGYRPVSKLVARHSVATAEHLESLRRSSGSSERADTPSSIVAAVRARAQPADRAAMGHDLEVQGKVRLGRVSMRHRNEYGAHGLRITASVQLEDPCDIAQLAVEQACFFDVMGVPDELRGSRVDRITNGRLQVPLITVMPDIRHPDLRALLGSASGGLPAGFTLGPFDSYDAPPQPFDEAN